MSKVAVQRAYARHRDVLLLGSHLTVGGLEPIKCDFELAAWAANFADGSLAKSGFGSYFWQRAHYHSAPVMLAAG